jgi:hypothetical protein
MKRLAMTIALTCVLCSSVLAGDVPCNDFAPPPPPATTSATAPGEIPCNDFVQTTTTNEVVLNVLEILTSGFLSIH